VLVPGIEEILLTKVANLGTHGAGDVEVVVDDKPDASGLRHRKYDLGQPANLVRRLLLGAKLDDVRTAVAQLPRHGGRIAPMQIGGVHKRVEAAVV
jgi:hypothetical protein